ncbi:hypothetical protein ACFLYS_01080 [Chloroflexota bacterium]
MTLSNGEQEHGVIITHGIGDQKRGDTIAEFSKAVYDSLIKSPKDNEPPMILLEPDISGNPSSVTLKITSPYGDKATWRCQEAHWNDAFPPPNATQVLWWGLNQNLRKQLSSIIKIMTDPTNKSLPTKNERQKEDLKKKRGEKTGAVELNGTLKGQVVFKSGVMSGIVLILLTPLAYVLLFIIWLLHFIPSIGPLDKIINWIRKLDPFLSSSIGDIKRLVDHEIWAANAKKRLEDIVLNMLNDSDIKDITIVAHSLGAVLAYEALTEGSRIAKAIEESGDSISKKITLVSVGGAINRVFALIAQKGYEHLQINKPLAKVITHYRDDAYKGRLQDKFYWLDIFARKDPISAGPIDQDIIEKKARIHPLDQMKERMVINKDSLIFDHNSYWGNMELVMPRITRAINGGEEYPWPEAGITEKKVTERIQKALKFDNLSQKIMLLTLLGLIVFLCLKLTGTI